MPAIDPDFGHAWKLVRPHLLHLPAQPSGYPVKDGAPTDEALVLFYVARGLGAAFMCAALRVEFGTREEQVALGELGMILGYLAHQGEPDWISDRRVANAHFTRILQEAGLLTKLRLGAIETQDEAIFKAMLKGG